MRWMIVLMLLAGWSVREASADPLDPLDFASGGDTDPSVPWQPGAQGDVSVADAPSIGVPEPSSELLGLGALMALACMRREAGHRAALFAR